MTKEGKIIFRLTQEAVELLKKMIQTPSLSREEDKVADVVEDFLKSHGVKTYRAYNNIWALCGEYDPSKPTLLLNSHLDTVKPSPSYSMDPYTPLELEERLYGLGSNDAGASVVSLIAAFLYYYGNYSSRDSLEDCSVYVDIEVAGKGEETAEEGKGSEDKGISYQLPINLLLGITAEEEITGPKGMMALIPALAREGIKVDMALVGEPTKLDAAIAEKGLMVFDGVAYGKTGHAARDEGDNALYHALDDINILRNFAFDKVSPTLGPIKVSVTMIEAGRSHNVIPEICKYVVDVRTTDAYSNDKTAQILAAQVKGDLRPRSTRIGASVISEEHPLVKAAISLGSKTYVSPTSSDRAVLRGIPALKLGPGDSARSHSADEYIELKEIEDGIQMYINLIAQTATYYQKQERG